MCVFTAIPQTPIYQHSWKNRLINFNYYERDSELVYIKAMRS